MARECNFELYRKQAIRGAWTCNVGQEWADLAIDLMEEFGTDTGYHLAADAVLAFVLSCLRGGIPAEVAIDASIKRDVKRAQREGEEQRKKTYRSLRAKDKEGVGNGYTEAELSGATTGTTTDATTDTTTDSTTGTTTDATTDSTTGTTSGSASGRGNGNGNRELAIATSNCKVNEKPNEKKETSEPHAPAAAMESGAACAANDGAGKDDETWEALSAEAKQLVSVFRATVKRYPDHARSVLETHRHDIPEAVAEAEAYIEREMAS